MPAWKPAAAIGTLAAVGVGGLAAWLMPENPVLAFAVFAAFLWAPVTLLCWAGVVDRLTVRGTFRNPEESVESAWYGKAAQGVFHDAIMVGGLGAGVFAFVSIKTDLSLVLIALTVLLILDFGLRYLLIKRRG